MKGRVLLIAVVAIALIAQAAGEVSAQREHSRHGLFVGFGLGGGAARPDSDVDFEGGLTFNLRAGYAPMDELTVGLEAATWYKEVEVLGVGTVDWTFSVVSAGVTYYPGNMGLFFKGGLGIATVDASFSAGGLSVSASESGFGLLGGGGYEFRLTEKFALGGEFDVAYLNVDSFDSALFYGVNVMFNWYWSDQGGQ